MSSPKLINLQLELLQIFSYNVQESQLLHIKQMLSEYFAKQQYWKIKELKVEKYTISENTKLAYLTQKTTLKPCFGCF